LRSLAPGTTTKWNSVSQALGHEIAGIWDDRSLANFSEFVNALATDRYFGMISGRPW